LAAVAPRGASTADSANFPKCATRALVVWLDTRAGGAAGSIYYKLEFTNLSEHRCTLRGFPGVSAIQLTGRQLGTAALRSPRAPVRTASLAHGRTASAVLQIANVENFPKASCRPVTAAGLRVYPPSQRESKIVPFPFRACSRTGPAYLHVEAVRRAM
jgi:hypothetical protein